MPQAEQQIFNIWVHGDKDLVRGSGLFVAEAGIGASHHFLLKENGTFQFSAGHYQLLVVVPGAEMRRLVLQRY